MCAPLWPTPRGQDSYERSNWKTIRKVNEQGGDLTLTRAVKYRNRYGMPQGKCPCRCHQSMSSAVASPVKTSPSPAREQDSTENARVFGRNTHGSLASFDPDTSSWRTSQLSLLGGLDEFSETWPRSGMTRNGTAYRLQPLAPLTGGTGSGLLPTPAANPAGWQNIEVVDRDGNPPTHPNQRWYDKETGRVVQKDLRHVIERGMWPTPRTSDTNGPGRHGTGGLDLRTAVAEAEGTATWRTPNANDGSERLPVPVEKRLQMGSQVRLMDQVGGQLNPTFVEFLMGFPKNWTEVE